ncbi:LuxR family transcriptional regulator [Achromobacter sp. GG226]|uniref:helix-turn-helix transcriptional regulator n=1 Tax=Verticiella alkaliphila TaxID=2779529 RepID=UPI001C0BC17B|nr:LuxR C-terminal-related transcriptional regulator [Verticiella sp. GG226]MBU4610865.1 LuxR family transcriptional regulator [Verticiella sp. GG226]
MRQWLATQGRGASPDTIVSLIDAIGTRGFAGSVLQAMQTLIPAGSWSAYQIGAQCAPRLYFSASRDAPDRTVRCWQAYLSGPHDRDRTLYWDDAGAGGTFLSHITSGEMPPEHRERVYEAHGMAERISIVQQRDDGPVFAVNFYRHRDQSAFNDRHLAALDDVGPMLLALARKHAELMPPDCSQRDWVPYWRSRLQHDVSRLTEREMDVCARILAGWSLDGIAADLGVTLTTVKTYRQRAFARMGIRFRNELFSRAGTGNPPAVVI